MYKLTIILILLILCESIFASNWECINRVVTCNTWRWKVPHGWLVSVDNDDKGASVAYYPDEKHEWKV